MRNIHPGEKWPFHLSPWLSVFPSIYSCGLIILIIAAAVILIGKVPVKTYLRLMLLPVFFLVASLLPILINTGVNPDSTLSYLIFFKSTIGITYNSLIKSGLLFMRSMALVSCLYFISLTTPILDIIAVMKKLKLPDILIDLMFLVYRQLFVMMDTAETYMWLKMLD